MLGAGGATMGRVAGVDQARTLSKGAGWSSLALVDAAALPADEVLRRLESAPDGLSRDEARARLARVGTNALRSHGARPFVVLLRQLRNPLLILLVAAAVASFAVGERTSALIILLIIMLSVGLGFFNEYRSELAVEALHYLLLDRLDEGVYIHHPVLTYRCVHTPAPFGRIHGRRCRAKQNSDRRHRAYCASGARAHREEPPARSGAVPSGRGPPARRRGCPRPTCRHRPVPPGPSDPRRWSDPPPADVSACLPLEASVRRGWRELSKRSSASVGAGAPSAR